MNVDNDWQNLVQRSQNLIPKSDARIHRSLRGIEKEAQRLGSRRGNGNGKHVKRVPMTQMKDFAVQAGFDFRQQNQLIATVDNKNLMSIDKGRDGMGMDNRNDIRMPYQCVNKSNMNLHEFLRYHNEYVISSTMQECQLLSARTFRSKYTVQMENEWTQTKKEILQYLGCNEHSSNLNSTSIMNMSMGMNMTLNNANPNQTALEIIPKASLTLLNFSTLDENNNSHAHNANANANANADTTIANPNPNAHTNTNTNRNLKNNQTLILHNNQTVSLASQSQNQHQIQKLNDWEIEFCLIIAKLSGNRLNTSRNNAELTVAPFSMFGCTHERLCANFEHRNDEFVYEEGCIQDIWILLSRMISETASDGKFNHTADILHENIYAAFDVSANVGLIRFLVNNAKAYLERVHLNAMKNDIEGNMDTAKLGGVMSNMAYITAFVRLQFENGIPSQYRTVSINNELFPLYPLLYYCLRIGEIDDCIKIASFDSHSFVIQSALKQIQLSRFNIQKEYTQKTQTQTQTQTQNKNSSDAVSAVSKHVLLIEILQTKKFDELNESFWQNTFDAHYKNNVFGVSNDPFEVVIYLVLGKFIDSMSAQDWDIDLASVLSTTEDYVWFKLMTLLTTEDELPSWMSTRHDNGGHHAPHAQGAATESANQNDIFLPSSLSTLQKEIFNLGPNHFENPLNFVLTLFLTLQFESAIEYLSSIHSIHAIHLAMCLHYYGLLNANTKDLLYNKIRRYCNKLIHSNSEYTHFIYFYLYLLNCDFSIQQLIEHLSNSNEKLIHEWLGTISEQGIRVKHGLLFRYPWQNISIGAICLESAKLALDNGDKEHCIRLFMFGGHYVKAAHICLKLLSSYITQKFDCHEKQIAVDIGRDLYTANLKQSLFHDLGNAIELLSAEMQSNLVIAMNLCDFFDYFYQETAGHYDTAIAIIKKCNLIPINDNVVQQFALQSNISAQQKHVLFDPYIQIISRMDRNLGKFVSLVCMRVMEIFSAQLNQISIGIKQQTVPSGMKLKQQELSLIISIIYHFVYTLPSNLCEKSSTTANKINQLYEQSRLR